MHENTPTAYAGRRLTIGCPHCGKVLKIRSSRQTDPIVRQLMLECRNDACCATFGADLTITHIVSAGARPDPTVQLRTTPPRRRPANDDVPPQLDPPSDLPPAANDDAAERAVE